MKLQDTLFPITEAQRTAFARQLRAGFSTLRFEPALEADFMQVFDRGLESRLVGLTLLVLVIWLGLFSADSLRIDASALNAAQHKLWLELQLSRWLVLAVLVVLAVLAWRRAQVQNRRAWIWLGALVLTLGSSWGTACYVRLGNAHFIEALLLLVGGLFLPIGMTLRQTVALSVSCLTGILGVGLLFLEGAQLRSYLSSCILMPPTVALGAFGAYYREYAQREQFLLRAELGWQASHDALTSLANRRLFDERLGILARQAHRETQYLALVLVDVDHFKRFNDQYGHPAGDAALQAVAEVLQGVATRPLDLAARLGGEEMALLLYGANAEAAQRLGIEALGRLRQLGISHQGSSTGRLSMCLGVSLLRPGESTESLYQRVDRLLYEAKEGGRDRMVFAA